MQPIEIDNIYCDDEISQQWGWNVFELLNFQQHMKEKKNEN